MSIFCTECGTELENEDLFCPECGNKVTTSNVVINDIEKLSPENDSVIQQDKDDKHLEELYEQKTNDEDSPEETNIPYSNQVNADQSDKEKTISSSALPPTSLSDPLSENNLKQPKTTKINKKSSPKIASSQLKKTNKLEPDNEKKTSGRKKVIRTGNEKIISKPNTNITAEELISKLSVMISNYRFTLDEITIKHDGKRHNYNTKKLAANIEEYLSLLNFLVLSDEKLKPIYNNLNSKYSEKLKNYYTTKRIYIILGITVPVIALIIYFLIIK